MVYMHSVRNLGNKVTEWTFEQSHTLVNWQYGERQEKKAISESVVRAM